jgi:hypothetical protein
VNVDGISNAGDVLEKRKLTAGRIQFNFSSSVTYVVTEQPESQL